MGLIGLMTLGAFVISGCSEVMKQVNEMTTFTKCQFRLASVDKASLAGIVLQGDSISDISALNLLKLQEAFSAGSLPLQFTVNLEVQNPNASPAGLSKMEWVLLVDGNQLTNGTMEKAVEIAPNGGISALPLDISLDLVKALSGNNLDSMVNLAMGIAGEGSAPTKVTLQVKPYMTIAGQALEYPGLITVTHSFPPK